MLNTEGKKSLITDRLWVGGIHYAYLGNFSIRILWENEGETELNKYSDWAAVQIR